MCAELTYSSIKTAHQIREFDEKQSTEKKRHLLCLIISYLTEEGYVDVAKNLNSQASVTNLYEVCDNIDLFSILKEYESYYYMRFQKYPKICKKIDVKEKFAAKKRNLKKAESKDKNVPVGTGKDSHITKSQMHSGKESEEGHDKATFEFTITPITSNSPGTLKKSPRNNNENDVNHYEKVLKPLGGLNGFCSEWKEFAENITKEICITNPNVHWNDIIGLDKAKNLLKEAMVYPIKYPELFSGVLAPWKGLLLYGPPGTGKTLLAKAVATKCKTTFFNISASTIVSKWRGDSEKLIRVLFDLARYHAPSTIFFDEIDAMASHRDSAGEHDSSKRLKAELLIQLDGLIHSNDNVFLLATSNLPWELDPAILRRLEKRILVNLPTKNARQALFQHYLPPLVMKCPQLLSDLDYTNLAEVTEGYSGSDIKLVCKETIMEVMRSVFSILEDYYNETKLPNLELKTITTEDVQKALARTKPSAAHLNSKYQKWQKEFGSV